MQHSFKSIIRLIEVKAGLLVSSVQLSYIFNVAERMKKKRGKDLDLKLEKKGVVHQTN